MECESDINDKFETVSSTILWKIVEWNSRPIYGICKSPTFSMACGQQQFDFELLMYRDISAYVLLVNTLNSPLPIIPVNCAPCVIDPFSGEHHLLKSAKLIYKQGVTDFRFNKFEVDDIYYYGGILTIQCNFDMDENRDLASLLNRPNPTEEISIADIFPTASRTLSTNTEICYKDKGDIDCVLKTKDTQFLAHRSVLSSSSEVFRKMFQDDTEVRRTGEIHLQDVETPILCNILHFIYSGEAKGLMPFNATHMYTAADNLALRDLQQVCLDFLLKHLEIGNICDAAVLAHIYRIEVLEETVTGFIVGHFKEIQESYAWKTFTVEKQSLAIKYLSSALLAKQKRVGM